MVGPVVCVFPHSADEFPSADALRNFLSNKLPKMQKGRYLLRRLGWKDKGFKARVIRESLVLFRKGAVIVGDAIVKKPIQKLEPPVHDKTELGPPMIYHHDIVFYPESIRVYAKALPIKTLESWSGQRLYPNFYAILSTRRDYEKTFPR